MAWWVWLIIVAVILIGGLIALYIVGNKLQKKQSAQKEMMKEQAQLRRCLSSTRRCSL